MSWAGAGCNCGRRICASECTALSQLEMALRLYFEGDELYSVITLAGASDGVWGELLEQRGHENAWGSLTKAMLEIDKKLGLASMTSKNANDWVNGIRNALRHFADLPQDHSGDPKEAAELMLERAIENYFKLTGTLTAAMMRFQAEVLISESGA